jgi:dihydrofolate synthase/folylpolyglutamate synthase
MALIAFAEAGVEVAILETGLGGRLDATTAANAEIAAITRIDLDHQQYLGDTIEQIATEKAAIIGSQTKSVVIGEQPKDALAVLLDQCHRFGVVRCCAQKRFVWGMDISGEELVKEYDTDPPDDLGVKLSFAGTHQSENAYTAVMVAGCLANDFGLDISEDDMRRGLGRARHQGRLEYSGRYLFDGAHNAGATRSLADHLATSETRPITLVFGAMQDKQAGEMLRLLIRHAQNVVLTQPANVRAFLFEDLLDALPNEMTKVSVFVTDTVAGAIDVAETVSSDEAVILVTGSLYLVGEVKQLLAWRNFKSET